MALVTSGARPRLGRRSSFGHLFVARAGEQRRGVSKATRANPAKLLRMASLAGRGQSGPTRPRGFEPLTFGSVDRRSGRDRTPCRHRHQTRQVTRPPASLARDVGVQVQAELVDQGEPCERTPESWRRPRPRIGSSPRAPVADVRGERRVEHLDRLELEGLDSVEQSLAGPEQDGDHVEREFVDHSGGERLTDG